MAVAVARVLRETFPEVELIMVGGDKRDGSLRRVLNEIDVKGLGATVRVTGAVAKSEVPRQLDQADIFINTADIDNVPVTVIEAMACGLPVVSTNVGGIPHLVEDGKDGLLVPPGNTEAMASAVKRLLRDATLAARLSENGRRKAECFDWSLVLPQWEDLFRSLAPEPFPDRMPKSYPVSVSHEAPGRGASRGR